MTPKAKKASRGSSRAKSTARKVPDPPAHLKAEGRKLWAKMWSDLPSGWSFDERERLNLALAGQLQDRLAELRKMIESDGVKITGSTGQDTLSKFVTEERMVAGQVSKLVGTLALPGPEGEPERIETIRGREGARKREATRAAWKAREAESRGGLNGKA